MGHGYVLKETQSGFFSLWGLSPFDMIVNIVHI